MRKGDVYMLTYDHQLKQITRFDVFIDLSSNLLSAEERYEHLRLFEAEFRLDFEERRITVARPALASDYPDCGSGSLRRDDAVGLLRKAISDAASQRRGLAVILGAWQPNNECISSLAELAECDPMIASAQPRFALLDADAVVGLPEGSGALLPLAALPSMPRTTITPELLSALCVLSPRGLLAAPPIEGDFIRQAITKLLIGLRRRGFRNLVCNHIAVPFPLDPALVYPQPVLDVNNSGLAWRQDEIQGRQWLANMPEQRYEAILAGAFSNEGRPRLLLDCRGVSPMQNGTALSVLGFLRGFAEIDPNPFDIVVLISKESALFHNLTTRFSCFEIQTDGPHGSFFAAVLLNQPWSMSAVKDLHKLSPIIIFNMLDTIAWDIIYALPHDLTNDLGKTWAMLGQVADGLLFISQFSLDRFAFRFAIHPEINLAITHLSTVAKEIIPNETHISDLTGNYLLVVGNNYDHKDVQSTLSTLVDAFPFVKIVALGINYCASPQVTALESGNIDGGALHALMANATAMIFPSHYEGFGMPVVEGLAHRTRVIVRDLTLWHEIASLSHSSELIVPFNDEIELVAAVGNALHRIRAIRPAAFC